MKQVEFLIQRRTLSVIGDQWSTHERCPENMVQAAVAIARFNYPALEWRAVRCTTEVVAE
jgi:hypothetical protein